MLGEVVSEVVAAFAPMDDVLVLGDAVFDPIKRISMALERRCLTVSLMMPDAHANENASAGWCQRRAVKVEIPWTWDQADRRGLIRNVRRRFNVMSACGRSWSHKVRGKSAAVVHNPAMK